MRRLILMALLLAGCATVRQEDTDAWIGQPVSVLQKQPVFLTMMLVRTHAADGTEVWNYVNARNVSACSGFLGGYGEGALGYGGWTNWNAYSGFTSCMQNVQACNHIFYIREGVVERLTMVGSGGAHCYSDERLRPNFAGQTNI